MGAATDLFKIRPVFEGAPDSSLRLGTSPDVFTALETPSVNLAIWRRGIESAHRRDLDLWTEEPQEAFDKKVDPGTFDSQVLVSSMPSALASWLREDVVRLLQIFARITESRRVRVQFHATSNDQCKKFHVDNLRYRMITTYLGPGTEYVPETNLNRQALENLSCDHRSANRAIVRDEKLVFRAAPGDVLLMKGLGASRERGAVHRSPPIEERQERRVVLVLSTVGL